MSTETTRIIGVGNPLMADDGLGIRAVELLEQEQLPQHVELIDGGCGGLKLLPLVTDCKNLILIDAADFNASPGEIRILDNPDIEKLSSDNLLSSAHHFDLPAILKAAEKLKQLPHFSLFLMQTSFCHQEFRLSNAIEQALPSLVVKILSKL